MAFDLEEQEKIESLKDFWRRNGTFIVVVFVVVAAVIIGWFAWDGHKNSQNQTAMQYYEIVLGANPSSEASVKRAQQATDILKKDFDSMSYTGRAALISAGLQTEQQQIDKAAANLNWLVEHKKDFPDLQAAAELQLASVLADQKKYDEALAAVEHPLKGYEHLYADRKADVLFAKGDQDAARKIWQDLASKEDAAPEFIQSVQFKSSLLNNIGNNHHE